MYLTGRILHCDFLYLHVVHFIYLFILLFPSFFAVCQLFCLLDQFENQVILKLLSNL